MKLDVTVDLEDIWMDNDTLATEIRQQIKYSIERAVKAQVNAAVKDALQDKHKEIKEAAKKYSAEVLKGLVK